MFKLFSTVGILLFLALASHVQAKEINASTLPYEHLFDEVSKEGETLDAFAQRIAPRLYAYSKETGYEACGVLAFQGDRFSVVVGTSLSHVACVNYASKVQAGFTPSVKTIHSHGGKKTFEASATDLILLGKDAFGSRSRSTQRVTGQNVHDFSGTDFEGGPGYLATPDGVIFQEGRGKVRQVN